MKCESRRALLKHRVTLQAPDRIPDGQGGYEIGWDDVATLWAGITPLKGYERMMAMQLQTNVTHRLLIRHRKGITTAHRLLFEGRRFDIKEIIDEAEAHAWLRLMCVETNQPSEDICI